MMPRRISTGFDMALASVLVARWRSRDDPADDEALNRVWDILDGENAVIALDLAFDAIGWLTDGNPDLIAEAFALGADAEDLDAELVALVTGSEP
jgi:hypothetical protein